MPLLQPQTTGRRPRQAQGPPRVVQRVSGKSYASKSKTTPASSRSTSAIKLESIKRTTQESPDVRGSNKAVLPKIRSMVERFDYLIAGNVDDLPAKPCTEVRIFLSSTFSDMRIERNWLAREAYPRLKRFCQDELGIDFSVIDMRWGVTDDSTNEHITEKLCLDEIANCQRLGLGPTFVAILGDRYGYRPLPSFLPETEFEILLEEVKVFDRDKLDLLTSWYVKDENAVPPVYVLQPISTRIPGFGVQRQESVARSAREQWVQVSDTLQGVLRTAADAAAHNGRISPKRRMDFYKSVTEYEICAGLSKAASPNASCLSFIRHFTGLDANALKNNMAIAQRFTEAKTQYGQRTLDPEAEKMRAQLAQQIVPRYLSKDRLFSYNIPWQPEGVRPEKYDTHQQYIQNFCTDFINAVLTQIGQAKSQLDNQIPTLDYYSTFEEILHHLHFCQEKVSLFRGQEQVLEQVKQYLQNSKHRAPLVLYAESGGGKTSLMAKIFTQLPNWLGGSIFRCIRFLGTSQLSTNIYDVLFTVLGQMADNYDMILEPVGYKTMRALNKYLPRYIRNVARVVKQPIVIMLDSTDQLSPLYDAYAMKWLMTDLPSNVHIIISTLPKMHGLLDNIKTLGLKPHSFVEVKPLLESTGRDIMHAHLARKKRKLNPEQMALVQKATKKVPNPLFLRLLLDRAVTWQSYTPVDDVIIPETVRAAILFLFEGLERKFGKVMISHTLGYITIGLNGLSEVELEDVLSCDDLVLDEVYVYHNPPVEGILRIPPVLWVRVRAELRDYLSERRSQGRSTLTWYHRQFAEAAKERYTEPAVARLLHQGLADYYQAEEGIQKDIILSKRKLTIPDADRQVTLNPLTPNNTRVLMTLPYHLRHVGDVIQLKMAVLCSLKFLMTKIAAFGVQGVLKDIEEVKAQGLMDADIRIIHKTLEEVKSTLQSSQQLPGEILARVPDDKERYPCASQLVSDCRNSVQNLNTSAVMPMFPCLLNSPEVSVETTENILEVLGFEANMMLIQEETTGNKQTHTSGDGKSSSGNRKLGILDYKMLPAQNVMSVRVDEDVVHTQLSKDGHLLNHLKNTTVKRVNKDGGVILQYDALLCQVSVTENVRQVQLQLAVPLEPDETKDSVSANSPIIVCYDVTRDNSLLVCCYVNKHVVVHSLFDGSINAVYTIQQKDPSLTASASKGDTILVQGTHAQCITSFFGNANREIVVIVQSEENGTFWTTLDVHHFVTATCSTIQIPGCVLKPKWRQTADERFVILPVEDSTGITRIVSCQLDIGKCQSFKISGTKVLDLAIRQMKDLLCYILTESKGVRVFDVAVQTVIGAIHESMEPKALCFAVEEDSEYIYLGTKDGFIRVWDVQKNKDLGQYAIKHKCSVKELYLTGQDEVLIALCDGNTLHGVETAPLLENCQISNEDNLETMVDNIGSLSDLNGTSVFIISSSNSTNELLTCTNNGHIITWNLDTLESENCAKVGETEFHPHGSVYSNTSHVIFYDRNTAVLVDLVDQSILRTMRFEDNALLSMTSDNMGVAYALVWTNKKLSVRMIDMKTGDVINSIAVNDTVNSTDIEIRLTENKKHLLFKVLCSEKELEILRRAEKAINSAWKWKTNKGQFKLLALDLSNTNGKLIPCLRNLTNIVCLVDTMEPFVDNCVLLGRERGLMVWDIESKANTARMIKGTKKSAFFRPEWIEDWEKDWGKLCYGQTLCIAFQKTEDGGICACGSEDGWLMIYDIEGRSIAGNLPKKPNNKAPVEKVCVSLSGVWVASCTTDGQLKVWSVRLNGKEIFAIKLNVKVIQMEFSADDSILAVLGRRSDGSTKILLFQIIAKDDLVF